MTSKQCNSCQWHIYVKELDESCFLSLIIIFLKNKDCLLYEYGETNQGHKEFFKELGVEYPFTEMR